MDCIRIPSCPYGKNAWHKPVGSLRLVGNRPLSVEDEDDPPMLPFPSKIECTEKLGGRIKQYRRGA